MGEWAEMAMDIEFSRIARAAGGRWINDVDEDGIPHNIEELLAEQSKEAKKRERKAIKRGEYRRRRAAKKRAALLTLQEQP